MTYTYSLGSPTTLITGGLSFATYVRNTQTVSYTLELSTATMSNLASINKYTNKFCTPR